MCVTAYNAPANHVIAATFSGDAHFTTSASDELTETVTRTVGADPDQNYVASLYQEVLGVPADPAGLDHWTAFLDNGGSRDTVVAGVLHSDQYYGTVVNGAFQRAFGRHADPSGLAYWVGFLHSGTDEQLLAKLTSSDEYFAHAGNSTALP